jgi:hypothetical protein
MPTMSYLRPALRPGGFESLDSACVKLEDTFVEIAKRIASCETQNQFNRVHIDLENILAPLELAGLAKFAVARDLPKPTHDWLQKFATQVPEILESPQQFERHTLGPLTLYQNAKHEVREKGLLVAFCGNARRLMVPVSIFLQFVDSCRWDMAVLKKDPHSSYMDGLGFAPDFRGVTDYAQATTSWSQYRRRMTVGTSSGGFAALWAALLMDAERGISIGGCPQRQAVAAARETRDRRPASARETELRSIYGEGCIRDQRSATALFEIFGGKLEPVPTIDEHNVLGCLLRRGALAPFLQQMLA